MTEAPNLSPCPFCGWRANLARIISPEAEARGERPSWDIDCTGCGMWRRFDSDAEAIEAWNRRAALSAPAVEGPKLDGGWASGVESVAPESSAEVVWMTRGMNARGEWFGWEACSEVRAQAWKQDITYRNGRRQVRQFRATASATPSEAEARSPQPVAWRCKDFADSWIIYQQESAAAAYRAETGCLMEPLYALPTPPKAEAE